MSIIMAHLFPAASMPIKVCCTDPAQLFWVYFSSVSLLILNSLCTVLCGYVLLSLYLEGLYDDVIKT